MPRRHQLGFLLTNCRAYNAILKNGGHLDRQARGTPTLAVIRNLPSLSKLTLNNRICTALQSQYIVDTEARKVFLGSHSGKY